MMYLNDCRIKNPVQAAQRLLSMALVLGREDLAASLTRFISSPDSVTLQVSISITPNRDHVILMGTIDGDH
jgi:hypothetical protein